MIWATPGAETGLKFPAARWGNDWTQIAVYTVADGRIKASETRFHINASGNPAEVATRFRQWLQAQPGGDDPAVVQDGRLRFDEASARHMVPWLERWKKKGRP